jgi:tRNA-modifying protein YgfZ
MAGTTLSDRSVIRISGDSPSDFLQGLLTQDMTAALPVWTALLTPQGKVLFDFIVWRDGDDLLLDCEATQAAALIRRLTLYRLRRALTIALDSALAVHWSLIPTVSASPDPRLPALGFRWLGSPGEPATGWLAHRLMLGVTEGVAELGQDKTLWLEANARELHGVSFTKGCYVGQENTARMHHRAKVARRLAVVEIGDDPGSVANIFYPELGLAVLRLRIEEFAGPPLGRVRIPGWLQAALNA